MSFTKALLLSIIMVGAHICIGQVRGTVTDSEGNALPRAVVYPNGGMVTMADGDGKFVLDLKSGTYDLTFRHIGFEPQFRNIDIKDGPIFLVVAMSPSSPLAMPGYIEGQRMEDPAFKIMRMAQRQRRFHREQTDTYSFTALVINRKGLWKKDGPPIGGLNEDPARTNSVVRSAFFYQQPDKEKEVVLSKKVYDTTDLTSRQSAIALQVRLYENTGNVGSFSARSVVSPLAVNARSVYRYRLLESHMEGSQLLHRIAFSPKSEDASAYTGILEIQDSTWAVHMSSLHLYRRNGLDELDSLHITQLYVPVGGNAWLPAQVLGEYHGQSAGMPNANSWGFFDNIVVRPMLGKGFFSRPTKVIEPTEEDKADPYFDTARTIQLTQQEIDAYRIQDSIARAERYGSDLDSTEGRNKGFEALNIATGYTYRDSEKGISYGYTPLLKGLQFNTVEGLNLTVSGRYDEFDNETFKRVSLNSDVRYGFRSHRPYARLMLNRLYEPQTFSRIYAEGGRYIFQFNADEPIPPLVNSVYSLLFEANYMKLYQKNYLKVGYGKEVRNGILLDVNLEYADRQALRNHSASAILNRKGRAYTSNNPLDTREIEPEDGYFSQPLGFQRHQALIFQVGATITFKQKFFERPGQKIIISSKYPQVYGQFKSGLPDILGSDVSFNFITAGVKHEMSIGAAGRFEYDVSIGNFITRKSVPFVDNVHFSGNQTIFGNNRLKSFDLLPYYLYSTNSTYYQAHIEHHFGGYLLNRIPKLGEYGLQSVFGLNLLNTSKLNQYYELTAGIENIFRVARVDFTMSIGRYSINDQGVRIFIDL